MMLALVRLLDLLFSTFSLSLACSLEALGPLKCDCRSKELCAKLASGTRRRCGKSAHVAG